MLSQRRIERHQLPYYLNVFNRITDKPMGFIGNVSVDGLMLISQLPMLVGGQFDMRLKIPGLSSSRFIDFSASCQWCREDVTPSSYDSGFALIAPPTDYIDMIDALRYYFSFHTQSASA
ncbi:Pilus assembly protein PilZ [Pseudomonas sp. 8Z]|uniref:PilZ domain-containing protein n=1 Tax=Pseudomonas sp. 8Z TaxID=2653166 RepID=UPI0012F21DC1|nr:PilZ domain-containing protein [Pseudomonas sp. 8Z]VXC74532.1 Pilus assembly protein PilZ [Pseudomonas sp. 8Z]